MQVKPVSMTRSRLLNVLADLGSTGEDYLTWYMSPSAPYEGRDARESQSDPRVAEVRDVVTDAAVSRVVQTYGTGVAVFWSLGDRKLVVVPPFGLTLEGTFRGAPLTAPLVQLVERERTVVVVLVTWGAYALGRFEGLELAESKTGTGYIHKRHRKGGRSEKRFARRTEEQKKDFLRRVANRVDERFRGCQPEQVFFGGNRFILRQLLDESSYLRSHQQRISGRSLSVRVADRAALLSSIEGIYRAVVFDLTGG